jgi:hypothetical protein
MRKYGGKDYLKYCGKLSSGKNYVHLGDIQECISFGEK